MSIIIVPVGNVETETETFNISEKQALFFSRNLRNNFVQLLPALVC